MIIGDLEGRIGIGLGVEAAGDLDLVVSQKDARRLGQALPRATADIRDVPVRLATRLQPLRPPDSVRPGPATVWVARVGLHHKQIPERPSLQSES
jgi:hypothetical protein